MSRWREFLGYFADKAVMRELEKAEQIVAKAKAENEALKIKLRAQADPITDADLLLKELARDMLPGQTLTINIPLGENKALPAQVHFDGGPGVFIVDTVELMMKAGAKGFLINLQ